MKRKKLGLILFSITAATLCAVGLAACSPIPDENENNPPVHTHSWSSTYTEDGNRHYQTCGSCNEKQYAQHSYNSDGVCICGKQKPTQGEDKPPEPTTCTHKELYSMYDEGQPSTCTEKGYKLDIKICTNVIDKEKQLICGTVFSGVEPSQKLGQLDHLTEDGFKRLLDNQAQSGREGYFGKYYSDLQLAEHTPETDEAVAATCVSKGKTEGSHCSVCKTVIKAQEETDFTEHDYSDTLSYFDGVQKSVKVCKNCHTLQNGNFTFNGSLNEDGNSYTLVKAEVDWANVDFGHITYNGKPITKIGKSAFTKSAKLESVDLNGITEIGKYAFGACSKLTDILLYDSLTAIDAVAFSGCGMSKIIIPDSVKSIGQNAFDICTNLTSVTIGKGVETICSPLFQNSVNLESVVWNATSCVNIGVPYGFDSTFYTCDKLKNLVIGDNVTKIPENTFNVPYFENPYFENVTLPASAIYSLWPRNKLKTVKITSGNIIGSSVFRGCTGLTSIAIPDTVTSIGDMVFDGCSGLTSIVFGGTIEQWKAIQKGYDWNSNTGNYTVTCTDGKLDKNGNVITV